MKTTDFIEMLEDKGEAVITDYWLSDKFTSKERGRFLEVYDENNTLMGYVDREEKVIYTIGEYLFTSSFEDEENVRDFNKTKEDLVKELKGYANEACDRLNKEIEKHRVEPSTEWAIRTQAAYDLQDDFIRNLKENFYVKTMYHRRKIKDSFVLNWIEKGDGYAESLAMEIFDTINLDEYIRYREEMRILRDMVENPLQYPNEWIGLTIREKLKNKSDNLVFEYDDWKRKRKAKEILNQVTVNPRGYIEGITRRDQYCGIPFERIIEIRQNGYKIYDRGDEASKLRQNRDLYKKLIDDVSCDLITYDNAEQKVGRPVFDAKTARFGVVESYSNGFITYKGADDKKYRVEPLSLYEINVQREYER